MEEAFVLRLHASHLTGKRIRPLPLVEARKVLQLSTPCPPTGTPGGELRLHGSILESVNDFQNVEVNLLVAKAEPSAVSSSEDLYWQMVLVAPVHDELLHVDKEAREQKEMKFQNDVWLVCISGSSELDVAEGLSAMSRAGVLREDFHPTFIEADKRLGRGSNASVFPISQRDMGTFAVTNGNYVAKMLKMPDQNCSVAKLHMKMRAEVVALVMARQHPNIVGYAGAFLLDAEEQQWAIVMQRYDGGTLSQAAFENRRRFSEGVVRQIMTGILSGLVHLHHTCRMVHRDVKAENVLLTETGAPVLADFGLATALPQTGKLHWRCGTPGYLAPEMLLDDGYDTQVDLYAAGAVFHFMVCGQAPFVSSSVVKTLRATLRATLDLSANPHFEDVSPLGMSVLMALLQRDPAVRPNAEKALTMDWFTKEIASTKATHRPLFGQANTEVVRRCIFHYYNDTSSSSSEEDTAGPEPLVSCNAPLVPTPPRRPRSSSASASVRNKVGGLLRSLVPNRIAAFVTTSKAPQLPQEEDDFLPSTPVVPAMRPVPPTSAAPKRLFTHRISKTPTVSKSVCKLRSRPFCDVTASTGVSLGQAASTGASLLQEYDTADDCSSHHAEDYLSKTYVHVAAASAGSRPLKSP